MNTTPAKCICVLVSMLVAPLSLPMRAFADGSDNFNDNSKDTTKWDTDIMEGLGVLTETNQRLEFTLNNALGGDDTFRPWKLERFPVNASWTAQVDTVNNTVPINFGEVNSCGFSLRHPTSADTEIYVEIYAVPFAKGTVASLETDGSDINNTDLNLAGNEAVAGAVRMEYDGATKVATCYYDEDTGDGYQWQFLASYGLDGANGTTANTDWNLATDQQFSIWVYGYAEFMTIAGGELYLDNFVETGGVPPVGGPPTVPTGTFGFSFPTNNPLLVAIASITGNYTGITRTPSQRDFDIDVAQDDAGKVVAMGTMEGITNADDGSSEIGGFVGAVTTINNEPTGTATGNVDIMRDATPITARGTSSGTLEFTDAGEGTNGVAVTSSGSANVAGVPLQESNTPGVLPITPGQESNLSKNWSVQLTITQQTVNGKSLILASAVLVLPNGDTIEFPQRKVKYSAEKGYKLSFKGGTNVTADPPRVVKKAGVSITGLTFQQNGDEWEPTGGIISYQFLGQKGVGNLLDFDAD